MKIVSIVILFGSLFQASFENKIRTKVSNNKRSIKIPIKKQKKVNKKDFLKAEK